MQQNATAALQNALKTHVATDQLDPRWAMAARLPRAVQPLLTWITAKPAPGESPIERPAWTYVSDALLWIAAGLSLGVIAFMTTGVESWVLIAASLLATSSGMGLFQVVVFHHCSHGTVFANRTLNRNVGRLVSATLLFKHFDAYQREHMMHHHARKLLTEEDEFADFVLEMCRLEPGLPKRQLWRCVLLNVVFSPAFHYRFLYRRIRASLGSADMTHNLVGIALHLGVALACVLTGNLVPFLVLWVLPLTILLQVATVGRILCEHCFPEPALIAARGREFVCRSTSGVFPGSMPPEQSAGTVAGFVAWTLWWVDMLTLQAFVRIFVLVGDAPCHDFHHRRPATRRWTDYIHARQEDVEAGCPGYPLNYGDVWGLFTAIDRNLGTLATTSREVIRPIRAPRPAGSDRLPTGAQ